MSPILKIRRGLRSVTSSPILHLHDQLQNKKNSIKLIDSYLLPLIKFRGERRSKKEPLEISANES